MRFTSPSLALLSVALVVLLGTPAAAQSAAPGAYKGQTTQGDPITITVGQNEIISWSTSYTCGGSSFMTDVTVPTNSCPILSVGSFQCGDTIPGCGTSSLQGDVIGPNMLTGVLAATT
ncbi:MAG TPA: hypothetical protein VMW75_18505 [Thermoanaerobaculia bacterium]|nr:hypothetical protein [Thermoanaerobaculia bacterium]